MVDIANVPFAQVPEEEQRQFTSKIKEVGSFRGYKHRQFWASILSHPSLSSVCQLSCHSRQSTTELETRLSTTTVCAYHVGFANVYNPSAQFIGRSSSRSIRRLYSHSFQRSARLWATITTMSSTRCLGTVMAVSVLPYARS